MDEIWSVFEDFGQSKSIYKVETETIWRDCEPRFTFRIIHFTTLSIAFGENRCCPKKNASKNIGMGAIAYGQLGNYHARMSLRLKRPLEYYPITTWNEMLKAQWKYLARFFS